MRDAVFALFTTAMLSCSVVAQAGTGSSEGSSLDAIALVTEVNYPDSLVMAPVSEAFGIPVLVTAQDSLSSEVEEVLDSEEISTVYLIGGPFVIGDSVEEELKDKGLVVVRLWGPTRVGTSVAVAEYFWTESNEVVVYADKTGEAEGGNYEDAMTARNLAAAKKIPLLIVATDEDGNVPGDVGFQVAMAIDNLGVSTIYLVGKVADNLKAAVVAAGYRVIEVEDEEAADDYVDEEIDEEVEGETDPSLKEMLKKKLLLVCLEDYRSLISASIGDEENTFSFIIKPPYSDEDISKAVRLAQSGNFSKIKAVGNKRCIDLLHGKVQDLAEDDDEDKELKEKVKKKLLELRKRWVQRQQESPDYDDEICGGEDDKLGKILEELAQNVENAAELVDACYARELAGEISADEGICDELNETYAQVVDLLAEAQVAYEEGDCLTAKQILFKIRDLAQKLRFWARDRVREFYESEVDKDKNSQDWCKEEADARLPELKKKVEEKVSELVSSGKASEVLIERAKTLLEKAQELYDNGQYCAAIELLKAAMQMLERAEEVGDQDVSTQIPISEAIELAEECGLSGIVKTELVTINLRPYWVVGSESGEEVAIDAKSGECVEDVDALRQRIRAAIAERLQEAKNNIELCTREYEPVCGVLPDGEEQTFLNKCIARVKGAQVKYPGECMRGNEIVCPDVLDPVCGVDGRTYPNACVAKSKGVRVAYEGRCAENTPLDPLCVEKVKEEIQGEIKAKCAEKCQSRLTDRCRVAAVAPCEQVCEVTTVTECEVECATTADAAGATNEAIGGDEPWENKEDCKKVCREREEKVCKSDCENEQIADCEADQGNDCIVECIRAITPPDIREIIQRRCEVKPELCSDNEPAVCGEDGNTYKNRCAAAEAGVVIINVGRCEDVPSGQEIDPDCAKRVTYACIENLKQEAFAACGKRIQSKLTSAAGVSEAGGSAVAAVEQIRERCTDECENGARKVCAIKCGTELIQVPDPTSTSSGGGGGTIGAVQAVVSKVRQAAVEATAKVTSFEVDQASPQLAMVTTAIGGDEPWDNKVTDQIKQALWGTGTAVDETDCYKTCRVEYVQSCVRQCAVEEATDVVGEYAQECIADFIRDKISICKEKVLANCVQKPQEACADVLDPVCAVYCEGGVSATTANVVSSAASCDYKTFANPCEARKAGAQIVKKGRCELDVACPDVYEPVCGEDGRTYPNKCVALRNGIEPVHEGQCEGQVVCPEVYEPVCGVDGKTYGNICRAKLAGVEPAYRGVCREEGEVECPDEYAPVCAVPPMENVATAAVERPEPKTYSNRCEAVREGAKILYEGECQEGQEPVICTMEYAPVCSVDGVTYGNKCMAEAAGAKIAYEGECRQQDEDLFTVCKTYVDDAGNQITRCYTPEGQASGATSGNPDQTQ